MNKLYSDGSSLTMIEKTNIIQALFINVDKIFTVGRNPLTPQITENVLR